MLFYLPDSIDIARASADYLSAKFEFDNLTVKVDGQCQIGKRNMPWLEAASEVDDIRILRVGHPERKKKVDFTNKISAWIQS